MYKPLHLHDCRLIRIYLRATFSPLDFHLEIVVGIDKIKFKNLIYDDLVQFQTLFSPAGRRTGLMLIVKKRKSYIVEMSLTLK